MSLTDYLNNKMEDAAETTYDVPEADAWPEIRLIDQVTGAIRAITSQNGVTTNSAG